MAERSARSAAVQVDSLSLRVPGQNAAFGRRVVERALGAVAERLPEGARGELAAVKLRVKVRGASEAATSEAIAAALLRTFSRRSG
jgi:hypothetical protein